MAETVLGLPLKRERVAAAMNVTSNDQQDRWEESDADWRPNRHQRDRQDRGAEQWAERWRETTSQWVATQRKRFFGTGRADR